MAKVRVVISGSTGKSVLIDTDLGPRISALETQVAALSTAGGATLHKNLGGLQVGDDHPQYTMWQAAEDIKAVWNFTGVPSIGGVTLPEYIQDTIGNPAFMVDTTSVDWTYDDTANTLSANVIPEFVQDVVGAMFVDSTSIDFTYNDGANTMTAAVIYANPTATVGLTAVNGSAATAMRSDAAPALNVTISPTWSGTHTFSNTPVVPNDSWTYAKIQNVSATSRVLGRISSGAGDIEELTGANLITILTAAGLGPANPTASVGLSAVNGSASTYMRSDGAPALSQAIAPTWTALHTFTKVGTQILTGTTTVNANPPAGGLAHLVDITSDNSAFSLLRISSYGSGGSLGSQNGCHFMRARGTLAAPTALMNGDIMGAIGWRGNDGTNNTGSVADFRVDTTENWGPANLGCQFVLEAVPTGTASRVISLLVGGDAVTTPILHRFTKIGAAATPSVSIESISTVLQMRDTDAATDEGKTQIIHAGNLFIMRKNNDANTDNRRFLEVQGSGAAVAAMLYGNATDKPRHTFNGVVRLQGYTVATLPAGTVGDTAYVTDALAPTFLAVLVGGGAITTTAFYNGSNWVAQ